MGNFTARWAIFTRFRKGRLTTTAAGEGSNGESVAVNNLPKINSTPNATATNGPEAVTTPNEFIATSEPSTVKETLPIRRVAKLDDESVTTNTAPSTSVTSGDTNGYNCCDCGMDCGLAGCTAFDGVS